MQNAEIKTIEDLYDKLTRRALIARLGATKQLLSNWKAEGQIPASRFAVVDDMCREIGLSAPRGLFAFTPPANSDDEVAA